MRSKTNTSRELLTERVNVGGLTLAAWGADAAVAWEPFPAGPPYIQLDQMHLLGPRDAAGGQDSGPVLAHLAVPVDTGKTQKERIPDRMRWGPARASERGCCSPRVRLLPSEQG